MRLKSRFKLTNYPGGILEYNKCKAHKFDKMIQFLDKIVLQWNIILIFSSFFSSKIKILYGGPQVFDHLINKTMWSDVLLSSYTLGLIFLFVFVLTSFSLFLTFFGIMSILLSLLVAFFFFRVVFGVLSIGILSGVSVFIIIGIGVDDIFVFINTFIHAKHEKDIVKRLTHTICTAGGATFFTSFTTAAAFGANCLSKVNL